MTLCGIYNIVNRINGKIYIGSSTNIDDNTAKSRWYKHKNALRNNRHKNEHLQNAWNKYGETNFTIRTIEETSENDLLKVEQQHLTVAKFQPNKYYNISFVAERPEMNKETRKRISKALTGKKLSKDHIRKMSLSLKGRVSPNKGLPMSDKQKRKCSIAHKGKKQSEKHKKNAAKLRAKNYIFLSPKGKLVYIHNLSKFCKIHKLSGSHMCQLAKGNPKYKSHKKWRSVS